MARKKKGSGKKGGKPAVLSLSRAKRGSIKGRKTVSSRGGRTARKVTKTAKSGKRSYR